MDKENNEQMLNIDTNEIHINIKKKDTGAILFDSDCCSVMNLVLTADGRLATSFFGLHTPEVIKAMKKISNQYYARLIQDFKRQYKEEKERIKSIKVFRDQHPEVTDEQIMKLAEEFREMKRREEEEKAIEMEKNKEVANRPAGYKESTAEKNPSEKKTTKSATKTSKKTTKK